MKMTLQEARREARLYLQTEFSDRKLYDGLIHLRSGNFAFNSCCCFLGMANADHAFHGQNHAWSDNSSHFKRALDKHERVHDAAIALAAPEVSTSRLARRLIPMFRAEIRRRTRLTLKEVSAPILITENA